MLKEDRLIFFTFEDVYNALVMRSILDGVEQPPKGKITHIQSNQNDAQTLTVEMELAESGEKHSFDITQLFFSLSLIFLCQGHGIPIPKIGSKQAVIKDDEIIFRIQIERRSASEKDKMDNFISKADAQKAAG